VIKMFNEVSSLLSSPLEIRRSEERTQECRARATRDAAILGLGFTDMLFASPNV
jgi:hypothetical protein